MYIYDKFKICSKSDQFLNRMYTGTLICFLTACILVDSHFDFEFESSFLYKFKYTVHV